MLEMNTANRLQPMTSPLADEEVVRRVCGGDVPLFEVLMRRHNGKLYRAIRSIVRDEVQTEEVMQEAYVRAFADGGWLEDGLHRGYARLFVSPRTYRTAGLPSAGAWPLVVLAQAPLVAAAEVARRIVPGADDVLDRIARARRRRWFERHMAGRAAEYRPQPPQ